MRADQPNGAGTPVSDSRPVPGVQSAISFAGQTAPASPAEAQGTTPEDHPPVWMQRTFMVIFVLLCLELGLVLLVAPWTQLWTTNSLVENWPNVRVFLGYNFVRGAVSGLGLLDLWLAIYEAVKYRDRR